jgi:hypothetical protein
MVLQDLFFSDASPKEKVFTTLTRPDKPPGFYTFGTVDEEIVGNNTIPFVDVLSPTAQTEKAFWIVPVPEFSVNGKIIKNNDSYPVTIIDTASNLAYIPDDVLTEIYTPVGGYLDQGLWLLPSNFSLADIPDINLPVGNISVPIAPADMAYDTNFAPGAALGSFQSNSYLGFSLYGVVWLRNVYAVFDLGTGNGKDLRFGVVPRAPLVSNDSF